MKAFMAAAAAVLLLAPAAALACGDSMAYAAPDQVGMQAPQPAGKPAATVAKASQDKAVKQVRTTRAPKPDAKVKVASTD
jgi:hypothetical protein